MQKSIFILSFVLSICLTQGFAQTLKKKSKYSKEVIDYFVEVALGSEYGNSEKVVTKWQGEIKLFVAGEEIAPVRQELKGIIKELNSLMKTIQIKEVGQASQANLVLFLGSKEDYARLYEPKVARYQDLGFFYVYPNENKVIERGSLYLDTQRMQANDTRFHFLREELTQCLGLMNDSTRDAESIFYQKWSLTSEFSAMDKQLVEMLYLPQVKAGMNEIEVRRVLESVER
jgi:hypothetical protein